MAVSLQALLFQMGMQKSPGNPARRGKTGVRLPCAWRRAGRAVPLACVHGLLRLILHSWEGAAFPLT